MKSIFLFVLLLTLFCVNAKKSGTKCSKARAIKVVTKYPGYRTVCDWVKQPVCKMTYTTQMKIVYEDECVNTTESKCETVYKETKAEDLCVKIPREKCETTYETEYVTEYEDVCTHSQERRCKTVHDEKCSKK